MKPVNTLYSYNFFFFQVYGVPFGAPVQYVVAAPVRAASPRGPPRPHQYNPQQLRALLAAYRVGMLALEAQARRVHDDRPQNKYSRYLIR